ncbi:MAG: TMEM175 family protein [Methanoregula sp.]|nr:TMEM175 family protein [Methanoregula sp.]
MSGSELNNPHRISKGRLETMVDTIFAFAMTLLVLSIAMPELPVNEAATELPGYLSKLLPQFILFIIAFLVLALFWIEHHRQFHYLRIVDPAILRFNIAILIFIVLIPFSTDVSGAYDGVRIAVLILHVNILILGALFLVHWMYLCRCCHLCEAEFDANTAGRFWILATVPTVAIFGIVVAFFSPTYSLLVYLLIPVIAVIRKGRVPDAGNGRIHE